MHGAPLREHPQHGPAWDTKDKSPAASWLQTCYGTDSASQFAETLQHLAGTSAGLGPRKLPCGFSSASPQPENIHGGGEAPEAERRLLRTPFRQGGLSRHWLQVRRTRLSCPQNPRPAGNALPAAATNQDDSALCDQPAAALSLRGGRAVPVRVLPRPTREEGAWGPYLALVLGVTVATRVHDIREDLRPAIARAVLAYVSWKINSDVGTCRPQGGNTAHPSCISLSPPQSRLQRLGHPSCPVTPASRPPEHQACLPFSVLADGSLHAATVWTVYNKAKQGHVPGTQPRTREEEAPAPISRPQFPETQRDSRRLCPRGLLGRWG